MKILFVDEDFDAAVVVRILANRYKQHAFTHSASLGESRRLLWDKHFDLAFLDIMLPADNVAVPGSSSEGGIMGGIQLYQLLRSDAKAASQRCKVYFITGLTLNERPELAQFAAENPAMILTKPMHPESFEQYLA